ncbi:MAG: hypothetical protein IM569_13795 [Chitinophagaceae bacterium]|jgi:hypothetical protein|nr:hypothetical protein [Chitinophagaceae bacterium]MCA6513923.1 hypothetical protein [Chitinophagaceae bacterium]
MNQSKFGTLNLRDALNGFLIAFLTAALSGLIVILDGGQLPTVDQLKAHALIGLTAGLSYVLKNLFQNSNGEVFKKEA